MTYFKKFRLQVLLFGMLFVLIGNPADAARKPKPKFQIKFATLAPEGSTWMNSMHQMDDEVRARTDNRLGFKFYPGGVQGDEKDVLRKIRIGQLHGGGFTGYGLGVIASDVRVLEMPFMFRDLDELDYVRDNINSQLDGVFDKGGYLNLGWVDVGFVYIFSKKPIATPDDLAAARMWIWAGDPLAELFFKAFGISPIPLSAPDVLTSLQTGVIDSAYSSTLGCMALQWFTRVSYMTDVPISHGLGAALISKKGLRKVSAEDLAILEEVSGPILRDLTLKTRVQNLEAIEEMKKEGVEIISVNDDVHHKFFTTGQGAWDDGAGNLYSAELLEKVKSLIAEYRAR
ncbi:MAG: ABC transporter substrate-binding protein [bacterium]|nr:ABC transporter substrate-binding protein [bacterium]